MSHPLFFSHLPFTTSTSPSSSFTLPLRHKNTKNTQYITHISKLSQSTSCDIKNHSGVKTCRVADSNDAPQNDVGRGLSEGTHCGNRRLQRGLLPVTSEPRRNRELLQRQRWDQTASWKPCQHSQVSRKQRERGTRTVRTFSRVPWRWNNHDTTVARSIVLNHVENTSRRKQEDTSMTFWLQNRNGAST